MVTFSISSLPGEVDGIELDHEALPYAGKFGRTPTGTAVLRRNGSLVSALSFSSDRTDSTCCRIRYLAVVRQMQGEGLAGTLASTFVAWALSTGYETIRITILNPYAVVALHRVGFRFTGQTGPSGGVVLEYAPETTESVVAPLDRLRDNTLTRQQLRYIERFLDGMDTASE